MVLRNVNFLGIRKKHIRIATKFDCVDGVSFGLNMWRDGFWLGTPGQNFKKKSTRFVLFCGSTADFEKLMHMGQA